MNVIQVTTERETLVSHRLQNYIFVMDYENERAPIDCDLFLSVNKDSGILHPKEWQ